MRKHYYLWTHDPTHPSLDDKQVSQRSPIFAVRSGIGWRAIGLKHGVGLVCMLNTTTCSDSSRQTRVHNLWRKQGVLPRGRWKLTVDGRSPSCHHPFIVAAASR
jgi:hypothetical protein